MNQTGKDSSISESVKALLNISKRLDKDLPSWEDKKAWEEWIDDNPGLFLEIWTLILSARVELIWKKPMRMTLIRETEMVSDNLGSKESPILEQLLIENVLTNRFYMHWLEYQKTLFLDNPYRNIALMQEWEKRLSAARRRHLQACEALVRVRRLARNTLALQANIATKSGQ